MPQYSLRTLLILVVIVSGICGLLFAVPHGFRRIVLLVGVLSLPGPLLTAARYGKGAAKSFALGGFVAYVAWAIVLGIPIGWKVSMNFDSYFGGNFGLEAINSLVPPTFWSFSILYLPWMVVGLGGVASAVVHFVSCRRGTCDDDVVGSSGN